MPLNKLPTDITVKLMSFLDNKHNTHIINTCKAMQIHGKEHGFVTSMRVCSGDDLMLFINRFIGHVNTIHTVKMSYMSDPHVWIPQFTEKLIFEHCSIPSYLNPGRQALATKYLVLTDYLRYKNHITVGINWECFRNLEYLKLYVYDVDLSGIENLTKLKYININTMRGLITTNLEDVYRSKVVQVPLTNPHVVTFSLDFDSP